MRYIVFIVALAAFFGYAWGYVEARRPRTRYPMRDGLGGRDELAEQHFGAIYEIHKHSAGLESAMDAVAVALVAIAVGWTIKYLWRCQIGPVSKLRRYVQSWATGKRKV